MLTIYPPFLIYYSSSNPASFPAFSSTFTLNPNFTSFLTSVGTNATRFSKLETSFGIPISFVHLARYSVRSSSSSFVSTTSTFFTSFTIVATVFPAFLAISVTNSYA